MTKRVRSPELYASAHTTRTLHPVPQSPPVSIAGEALGSLLHTYVSVSGSGRSKSVHPEGPAPEHCRSFMFGPTSLYVWGLSTRSTRSTRPRTTLFPAPCPLVPPRAPCCRRDSLSAPLLPGLSPAPNSVSFFSLLGNRQPIPSSRNQTSCRHVPTRVCSRLVMPRLPLFCYVGCEEREGWGGALRVGCITEYRLGDTSSPRSV